MTLDTKRGADNVLQAMVQYISGELPAAIATRNAATSAELVARLKGPYTFSGSKTLALDLDGTAITTLTVADSTYTAAQLAAHIQTQMPALGIDTYMITCDTVQAGNYLRLYVTTRGAAGSLTVGDTTGAALLGWPAGYTGNYMPLRDLAEIDVRYTNTEPLAYPALHLRCTDAEQVMGAPQMMQYTVAMRLYEASLDAPFGNVLYLSLVRTAQAIVGVLTPATGSRSLGGQVNAINLDNYSPAEAIESDGAQFRAYVDFQLTVQVQED